MTREFQGIMTVAIFLSFDYIVRARLQNVRILARINKHSMNPQATNVRLSRI